MKRWTMAMSLGVAPFVALLIVACSTGPVRRVSEPAANIQQLTVRADGSWSLELRIDNFSTVPMRFETLSLAMTISGQSAGTLQAKPGLSIGPESADVATVGFVPLSAAKIVIADALARNASVNYTLEGTLDAAPQKGSVHSYKLKRENALSPVPGVAGVLR
ncbi:MAG: hypothetical protein ABIP11_10160 [Luteimonas sp.]